MRRTTRIAVMLAMVLILIMTMTVAAAAGKPAIKGKAPSPTADPLAAATVYADDPGWVTSGTWALEDYAFEGGQKILVGNDLGDTASYTFNGKYKDYEVYASRYWTCGSVEIWVDDAYVTTVDLYLDADNATYGNLICSGKFPGNPHDIHKVEIRPTGTGGPGIYTFSYIDEYGVTQTLSVDLTWAHFANVQYVKVW